MSFPPYPTTKRQKQLVDMAGELADVFARRADQDDWEGTFPYENYKDLQAAGYHTLTVPRAFGGWGADLLEVTLAQERLARGDASTALVMSMHLAVISRIGGGSNKDNEHYARICRAVVEDGALINSAATEPATGSPSRGGRPTTTARRQSDGSWMINGRKTYTTGSPVLQLFLVQCSIDDEAPAESDLPSLPARQGTFIIPRNAEGLRIEDTWNTLSMRGTASNDLVLENVHLPADAYAGELISATPEMQQRQAGWSLAIASVYQGIAQAARDTAIQFAGRRRPNSLDRPISSVPHIQEKAAKMDIALLQSRAVLFGLAASFSDDPASIHPSQFAAAKYIITNHAVEIVDLAMRMVGGASLALSLPMQRYYRDVRAGLHNPPMDDATIAQLAKRAFES